MARKLIGVMLTWAGVPVLITGLANNSPALMATAAVMGAAAFALLATRPG